MLLIEPHFKKPGALAIRSFCQVLPPSRERLTMPSFEPIHSTPFSCGASAIEKIVQHSSTPRLSRVSPPDGPCLLLSSVVRSGLMIFQLCPAFVVTCRYWLPTYTVLLSCGEMYTTCVQFQRYLESIAGASKNFSGHTSTERVTPARTS